MCQFNQSLFSVVVPLHNESAGLSMFHKDLLEVIHETAGDSYEIIYCDDGSNDGTAEMVQEWNKADPKVKLLKLSRNFGKESALSAGIAEASGQAILMLDGDGQHPVELIPKFIDDWNKGAKVVIGVRTNNKSDGAFKHFGSWLFYKVFNKLTGKKLLPGSTDFRLIDSSVQREFLKLKESDRLTRGLIDWLGFERSYINFEANERAQGNASYSRRKLMGLAANSFVSLTPVPLHIFGYVGLFITTSSLLLGLSVIFEQLLLGDPLHWRFTGTAMIGILMLFLVGIVLISQGILSLYISHIHSQSKQRPLYVVDYAASAGVKEDRHAKI